MDLEKSLHLSAAGLRAQGTRLRVISENLANANSTAREAGGEPYRRKLVAFANEMNRALGVQTVRVSDILTDKGSFGRQFQPGHPAADEDGYVLLPNVNPLMEMSDMREAQRTYEANLRAIQAARTMLQGTIDLLR
ncbi:MAG: flagellar basal body rod protein FlgC [Pseudomonadota bacterium]